MKLHHIAIVLFTLLFTLTGCTSLAPSHSPEKSPAEKTAALVSHINASTVALVAITHKGEIRPYCTGVWVDDNTLVTAHHCVAAAARLALSAPPINPFDDEDEEDVPLVGTNVYYIVLGEVDQVGTSPFGLHVSTAIQADKSHDIAVLRARGKALPFHEIAVLAEKVPGVGETIHVVGQVKGLYWSYVTGVISGYRDSLPARNTPDHNKGPFVQVSAPVYFGNSGGGVFNNEGELVGIASFLGGAPNTTMFVHVQTVRKALEESRQPVIKHITIEIK